MALTMGATAPRAFSGVRIRRDSFGEAAALAWCKQGALAVDDRRALQSREFEDWLRTKRRACRRDLSQAAAYVLRQLISEMDWKSGFLRIAYAALAHISRLARSTVQVVIKQLERLGIVEKLRTIDLAQDPAGPAWVQGWNAYRLRVPAEFRAWLGNRACGPVGLIPADQLHAARQGQLTNQRHHAEHLARAGDEVGQVGAREYLRRNPLPPAPPLFRKLLADSLKGSGSS